MNGSATAKPTHEAPDVETSSDDYARRFTGVVGAWFLHVQTEATLAMLKPYPQASILDVGGGHGQITQPLIDHGFDVTVFGSDPVCIKRIEPLVQVGLCRFEVGDLFNLPYADQSFDVVITYRLLAHVEQWQRLIAELSRVARHAVILDYPEIKSANYFTVAAPRLFQWKKGLEGNTRTYLCYRRPVLERAFAQHGLVYGDHDKAFFMPMVVHRKLKSPGISQSIESVSRALGLTGQFGSPVILKMIRQ